VACSGTALALTSKKCSHGVTICRICFLIAYRFSVHGCTIEVAEVMGSELNAMNCYGKRFRQNMTIAIARNVRVVLGQ
jgi:hypothetical protein